MANVKPLTFFINSLRINFYEFNLNQEIISILSINLGGEEAIKTEKYQNYL